ncbi:MAG: glycoside hydrolase family 44 protein, partial [Arenicellales bacterium]|nr:glycoside hydrolase family 44 protein [Arenicellales bacterium]
MAINNHLTRGCWCPVTRIALVTVLALGLWCQCLVAVAQQLTGAYRPRGPVIEVFGINEAISFPEKFERRGVKLEVLRRLLDQQGQAAAQVGARWTRGHTVAFPRLSWDRWEREARSFARADLWLQAVQRVGLEAVVMIGPWPGNKSRDFTSRYVLQGDARERYVEFVRAAVERYDGDGLNDMPGLLRGVRFWEVDNEPDLKNSGSPRVSKRSNFCTPEQFAEIVILTARAIKSADPGARVLNGGLYRVTKEFGYRYLRDLLAVPGLLAAIDILSVHAYHTGRDA